MVLEWINTKLEVKSSDPNEQRRARLLNILLFAVLGLTLLALLGAMLLLVSGLSLTGNSESIIVPALVTITALTIISGINRYFSPRLASTIFLVFLIALLYSSAPPYENVWGRNMIMLAIPIVMASVILGPLSSFVVASLITLFFAVVSYTNDFAINFIGNLAYFAIALVAWLSASTLEKALNDLREVNLDLDNKVDERTKELVLANEQITEARDVAVVANQYKSELTAKVSHELRTPLGAILGYAEMLWGGYFGPVNDAQKQKLESIIETTKNLSSLISDWLDQARLESRKIQLNYHWFGIRELVAYVESVTRVLVKEKPIALKFDVDTTMPTQLIGDSGRVQQIMINLVSNAIKYTEKGTINVGVFVDDARWVIQVKDTGIGIPSHVMPTIFEPFMQADGSKTRKHEGFGLGLSIVKQLVDLMGGDIRVESTLNKGSVFTVTLPIVEEVKEV